MATRGELQAQLDRVEARIAETRQQMEGADFEIRQALAGRLSLLEGRAQSLRQQIAMTPAPMKQKATAKKKVPAKKKALAKRRAR